jgi:hypothetical protein
MRVRPISSQGLLDVPCDVKGDLVRFAAAAAAASLLPAPSAAAALDAFSVSHYNALVGEAQLHEAQLRYATAANKYMEALEICDADAALHAKLAWLRRELLHS